MGNERIRTFLAVRLSEAARRAAAALARALAAAPGGDAVRWVRPETLHVTLRFLGNVEAPRLPDLARRAGEAVAGVAPFPLSLGRAAAFPSPRRPRVVVLEVAPEAPLRALADAVESAVVASGFEPEARRFRAHLTLGRVRGRGVPDVSGAAAPPPSPFDVTEVVLFRSELGPGGARYTPLERMALGGSVHPDR